MKPALKRYEEKGRPPRPNYQLDLGTTALLGLFFSLAIVCGMFFAFGYTLGKHAIPATFSLGATPSASARPPVELAPAPVTPAGVEPPNPTELGAAEANQTPTTLAAPTPALPSATPSVVSGSSNAAPPATGDDAATALPNPSATIPAANTTSPTAQSLFHVQVFAGIKADAESLATALQQRGYPATVVPPNPGETDLYRVQVGPYLTVDEAQAMRSRLTADGYQAIVKP